MAAVVKINNDNNEHDSGFGAGRSRQSSNQEPGYSEFIASLSWQAARSHKSLLITN
jgi:hypothetical protein